MQSPLDMQDCAHLREASGPWPVRTSSMMPPIVSSGFASAMPAGLTLGQTSTHLPHRVQASSISSTRSPNTASNGLSSAMSCSNRADELPCSGRKDNRPIAKPVWTIAHGMPAIYWKCRPGRRGPCRPPVTMMTDLRRGVLQRVIDHPRQRLQLKRFLQRRAVAIFLGQARRAVAGGEDEGAVAGREQVGNRRDHLAVDVDIQDGEVEVGALGQLERFVDLAGLGSNPVAELFQHVGNHHPDHHLVLDEEHRTAHRACRCHCWESLTNSCRGWQLKPGRAMLIASRTPLSFLRGPDG